ncbi:hypothetical protein BOTBODRAFT_174059 [Botryobasidium botryosum FD-172 SS1]|uniref:Uncharacterized protein n=1 Tax=Botryobasidium botryosum (strain FD-172 SS1) TaxID=930990 RepID=A0A067MUE7_BOTB1|nr:hypothetical protein BOTBODRAFT_174059 [Botryobasidium botryosum FD-172 SS1]
MTLSRISEPLYDGREGPPRPVISTAAPEPLRSVLKGGDELYSIGRAAIEHQFAVWEKIKQEDAKPKEYLGKLFDVDFNKLVLQGVLGQHPQEDAAAIESAVGESKAKAAFTWIRIPYAVRRAAMSSFDEKTAEDSDDDGKQRSRRKRVKNELQDELVDDIDEWILRNEIHLRSLSKKGSVTASNWTYGLVTIAQFNVNVVFPATKSAGLSTSDGQVTAFEVPRPSLDTLPGYHFLHEKRAAAIYVQPSLSAFQERWNAMTGNILSGLDWSNVFIAGGLVLGVFLSPTIPAGTADAGGSKPDDYISSDIDLYIYGLGPIDANAKIAHIADTYKANLPKDAPFLVVRNSQTVTLYSEYPKRRVQIVLKLVGTPREVLLNFDLDICAIGYDGKDVWMLPRCARALETGFNVFTMDLINGHYLGDRKATRDQRVFKYANKGYGIRILPSYVSTLSTYTKNTHLEKIARGEELLEPPLAPDMLHAESRDWTQKVIQQYLKAGHGAEGVYAPFHWPSRRYPKIPSEIPVFSHAMLESYYQITSEPLIRSCLTSFSLLLRHVALWEEEVKGKIIIFQDLFASDTYGEGSRVEVAYDDTPMYKWDENFNLKDFKSAIDEFNAKESKNASHNGSYHLDIPTSKVPAARVTYATSVDKVFSAENDVVIPLIMTPNFMEFANDLIVKSLQEALKETNVEAPIKLYNNKAAGDGDEETLVIWRLDRILNWQMFDRRIDEVREVLWAFHRANERLIAEMERRVEYLKTNISRRAIRTSVDEEMEAFVRWVGKQPWHLSTKLNAMYEINEDFDGLSLGGSDEDGEEEEKDEDEGGGDDDDEDE